MNAGLALYNPKDSSFKHFLSNADDSASIGSNAITSILQDKSGNFWFSTENVGNNRLIKGTHRFRHYLPGIDGLFMYEDSEGSIWCGTRKGLYRYNKKDDSFSPFFDSQSEISKEGINAIIEDDGKNLWVTTPSVIIKLNPARNETVIYDSRFGIINTLQRGAIYKTANGQILVGHEKGFYTFFPNELAISFPTPKIVITDLSINNLPVLPGKGNLLQKPIGETDRIVLKYNLNNIAFNFSAIDYRAPETIKYFTKLENYDDTWRETGAEKSAYYFYVNPGTYVFRVRAINSDGTIGEKAITIRINPPWWKTWLFRIAAVICLVGLLYSLIRWRLQHKFRLQLERSEKERQMAELKQKGTELEMQALRAQMNPHFIFNSLNSINRFILQNNKAQASEYLTKFSKLVRMILQNSQASLITLENELESLELYLELEALRFNYHFDYKISVPKEMDISVLKVPPLILQPYVENAIWHGLMHKEEKGHLDIEVTEENDHLYFKIADNGIGREKAAALASKSATKHKSMGLRITAHRIAILQNSNGLTSPVTINDLVDADGNAAGTEVTIKMPVLYD